jgi:hypothetical protein
LKTSYCFVETTGRGTNFRNISNTSSFLFQANTYQQKNTWQLRTKD